MYQLPELGCPSLSQGLRRSQLLFLQMNFLSSSPVFSFQKSNDSEVCSFDDVHQITQAFFAIFIHFPLFSELYDSLFLMTYLFVKFLIQFLYCSLDFVELSLCVFFQLIKFLQISYFELFIGQITYLCVFRFTQQRIIVII